MALPFRYIPEDDRYVLAVPEMKAYRLARSEPLTKTKSISNLKYTKLTKVYLEWFIDYANGILKTKIFNDEQMVCHIFRPGKMTAHQFREFLQKSLYISREYIQYLLTKIDTATVTHYDHLLHSLDTDLEWLIVHYEVIIKKTVDKADLSSGRRPNLSPTDIYSAARELFFIEERKSIKELYLRDLKPVVMFQIRQMTEVFGKNLIGYASITDSTGATAKKFTQVSWEFIQLECKSPSPRLEFPFDVNLILPINKWANSFVHSTYIYSGYIQYYALKVLGLLFRGSGSRIITFDGHAHSKFDVANIKIHHYNSLKIDFETYLETKLPGVQVEWLTEKRVGAYIISL